jgi:hypothetical protein
VGDNAFIVGFTLSYIFCIVHSWKPRIRDSFGLLEVGKSLYFIFLCAVLFPSHMPLSPGFKFRFNKTLSNHQVLILFVRRYKMSRKFSFWIEFTSNCRQKWQWHDTFVKFTWMYLLLKTQELYLVERKTKKYSRSLVFYSICCWSV